MHDAITSFQGKHRWLSNFAPCWVVFEGVAYPSVENAYQAAKTDPSMRDPFTLVSPGQAKKIGRRVPVRPGWTQEERLRVMTLLLEQKFRPDSHYGQKLMATGHCQIVEGNEWNDTFWGVCRGKGENHMGKLLMARRSVLVNTRAPSPRTDVQTVREGAVPRFKFHPVIRPRIRGG